MMLLAIELLSQVWAIMGKATRRQRSCQLSIMAAMIHSELYPWILYGWIPLQWSYFWRWCPTCSYITMSYVTRKVTVSYVYLLVDLCQPHLAMCSRDTHTDPLQKRLWIMCVCPLVLLSEWELAYRQLLSSRASPHCNGFCSRDCQGRILCYRAETSDPCLYRNGCLVSLSWDVGNNTEPFSQLHVGWELSPIRGAFQSASNVCTHFPKYELFIG
jgi:hypothetical protein